MRRGAGQLSRHARVERRVASSRVNDLGEAGVRVGGSEFWR